MVKRPRNHVLETMSFRAFEDCIPPEWVVRSHFPDYGIDREVEIFPVERARTCSTACR